MLTIKQSQLLRYLIACDDVGDAVSPTFDQMAAALGIKSKSGIHKLMVGLEERKFIKRRRNRARAITILRRPGAGILPDVSADDLKEMVSRLCLQEGPEVAIAALSDCAQQVTAMFLSTEGNA